MILHLFLSDVYTGMYKNKEVIEKTSNEAFQAYRFEVEFTEKNNIICGIVSRQHNFADCFLEYF